jgi:5-methylcytosine-specific restriction endonuclease McrA
VIINKWGRRNEILHYMKYPLKAFIIAGLRRLSYRWPGRYNAAKKAKLGFNSYQCNICKGAFKHKETVIDHIEPVVDPEKGFLGWDEYIPRMFPDESGFQTLCRECHKLKTKEEGVLRAAKRKLDKLK